MDPLPPEKKRKIDELLRTTPAASLAQQLVEHSCLEQDTQHLFVQAQTNLLKSYHVHSVGEFHFVSDMKVFGHWLRCRQKVLFAPPRIYHKIEIHGVLGYNSDPYYNRGAQVVPWLFQSKESLDQAEQKHQPRPDPDSSESERSEEEEDEQPKRKKKMKRPKGGLCERGRCHHVAALALKQSDLVYGKRLVPPNTQGAVSIQTLATRPGQMPQKLAPDAKLARRLEVALQEAFIDTRDACDWNCFELEKEWEHVFDGDYDALFEHDGERLLCDHMPWTWEFVLIPKAELEQELVGIQ